jgi:hypothetical protein
MEKYDFGLAWRDKKTEPFVEWLQRECRSRKMSFIWCHDENIRKVVKDLQNGKLKIGFLLDTEATYSDSKDPYAKLCYKVKDTGGKVVDDPDDAKLSIDKSVMHYKLREAGIHVPYTVVIRNWEPDKFELSQNEKQKLGKSFIIKPALGYAQQGVIKNAKWDIKEIAKARKFDKGDNFLLQKKIEPTSLGPRKAWFRIFYLFGEVIPCWWEPDTRAYEHVKMKDFIQLELMPLINTVLEIARISNMEWFSTEIALRINKKGERIFVAIDYVNDQCDMTVKSQKPDGVPDDIVDHIAKRFVRIAQMILDGQQIPSYYSLLLAK